VVPVDPVPAEPLLVWPPPEPDAPATTSAAPTPTPMAIVPAVRPTAPPPAGAPVVGGGFDPAAGGASAAMQAVLANASIKQDKSAVSFMGLLSKADLLTAITAYKGVILIGILQRLLLDATAAAFTAKIGLPSFRLPAWQANSPDFLNSSHLDENSFAHELARKNGTKMSQKPFDRKPPGTLYSLAFLGPRPLGDSVDRDRFSKFFNGPAAANRTGHYQPRPIAVGNGAKMSLGLVGRKVGMTRIFTDDGDSIPVTVLGRVEQPRDADQDA
jgi:hypothetical protein